MGLLGASIGGYAGSGLGEAIGKKYGGSIGQEAGKNIGRVAGTALGGLLPFKTGGRVPGKKGAPKKILAHGGEYVLPVGVKPTEAQVKAVESKKKNARVARSFKAQLKNFR